MSPVARRSLLLALLTAGCGQVDTFARSDGPTDTPSDLVLVNSNAPTTVAPAPQNDARWASGSVHPLRWPIRDEAERVLVSVAVDDRAELAPLEEVDRAAGYLRVHVPVASKLRYRVTYVGANATVLGHVDTVAISVDPSQAQRYSWSKVTSTPSFGPREGAGGVVLRGRLFLLGGLVPTAEGSRPANDVWSSSDGATWVLEKPNTFGEVGFDPTSDWEGRGYGGYVVKDDRMWILGGDVYDGRYRSDVWASSDGRRWTRVDRSTPVRQQVRDQRPGSPTHGQWIEDPNGASYGVADFGARAFHVSATFKGRLWVFGGQRLTGPREDGWPVVPGGLSDIWASETGERFEQIEPTKPSWGPLGSVREAVEHQGRLWLVGGGLVQDGQDPAKRTNGVWSTADGRAWEKSSDEPPFSARVRHVVKAFDERLWVVAGDDSGQLGEGSAGGSLRDAWYSSDGRNWYEVVAPAELVARRAATAWVTPGALYVGAGHAFDGAAWGSDVWRVSRASP